MVSSLSGELWWACVFHVPVLKLQGTSGRRPSYRFDEWRMARIPSYPSQLGQPKDPNRSYTYRRSTHGWHGRSTSRSTPIHATTHYATSTWTRPATTPHDGPIRNGSFTHGSSRTTTSSIILSSPYLIIRRGRRSNSRIQYNSLCRQLDPLCQSSRFNPSFPRLWLYCRNQNASRSRFRIC
jgi:hypothetical protein